MIYSIIQDPDAISMKKLDHFLSGNGHGNVFQSREMCHFFRAYEKWRPIFLCVVDGKEKIRGLLVGTIQREKKGFPGMLTARCIVTAGPVVCDGLSRDDRLEVAGILLDGLVAAVKHIAIYIQIRNLFSQAELIPVFQSRGFQYFEHLNFIVGTSNRESLEKRVSGSKRRQIRQSIRNGARIVEPEGLEEVEAFFRTLKELYRRKVKKPLPDWRFFREFFLQSLEGRLGKYFLIEYQREIIGGIMCPITPGKGIYEWYICGRDGEFKGIYPSVLATWAAIDYALENGLQFFDFMGAGAPDQDYGVREFKSKFGGELVAHGRFTRINRPWLFALGKFGIKLMGKLR